MSDDIIKVDRASPYSSLETRVLYQKYLISLIVYLRDIKSEMVNQNI